MTWYRFRIGLLLGLGALGCDGTSELCASDEERVGVRCVKTYRSVDVRLNSVGYAPSRSKLATIKGGSGAFRIVDTETGDEVFAGKGTAAAGDETGEGELWVADFSELGDTGEFELHATGVGKSAPFRIAPDVYAEVLRSLMLGLYGQRCGSAVEFRQGDAHFAHGECHLDDAWLDEYGDAGAKKGTLYGWHDAGDYGKYTNNGAFSLGMMLLAWEQFRPALEGLALEIPERGGALPDYLDECKFQLDWLLGMQLEDGSVADRVTTSGFDSMVSPEDSTGRRRLAPPTTTATADFVAVVARAARAFEPYDAELAASYRAAAEAGWAYLVATPEDTTPPAAIQQKFTGSYWSSDPDDRLWAAAELWATTGDADALQRFEAVKSVVVEHRWDWPNLTNLAVFTYLLSDRPDRDPAHVAALTAQVIATAASVEEATSGNAYGNPLQGRYYWGSNGITARAAMVVGVADALDPGPARKDVIAAGLDHLLGRNYFGRSFVTGLGYNPPQAPHHRPSVADSEIQPWPGLLIGGPNGSATEWVDASSDYESNEVAINWNAAMIYGAASLLPE